MQISELKRDIRTNQAKWCIVTVYVVFTAIQASCLQLVGDDFWWAQVESIWDVWTESSPNGRYFSNMITFLMVRNEYLRWIIYFFGSLLLFFLMTSILKKSSLCEWKAYAVVSISMLLLPFRLVRNVTNWVSGFPNYMLSAVFVFFYLHYFCIPVFSREKVPEFKGKSLCLLLLGFLSALFVENVTIYILMLSVFMIIFSAFRMRKADIGHILYLVGAVAGTVLMFSDRNYHSVIVESSDSAGARFTDFSMLEIIMKIYNKIIPLYIKPFFVCHLVLAVCLVKLYFQKYTEKSSPKYAKPCLAVVILFAFYSATTQIYADFEVTRLNYLTRALETALTFLYLISLIYLYYQFLSRELFQKCCLFLVSHLLVVAPFLIANPVTGRCFFTEYLFWVLMTGTVLAGVPETEGVQKKMEQLLICSGVLVCTAIFSFMHISNKYYDNFRIKYLKEQLDSDVQILSLIEIPYPDLVDDAFLMLENKSENVPLHDEVVSYCELMIRTYDLNPKIKDMRCEYISVYTYYLTAEADRKNGGIKN
ncbi:MAG: hypothetical protein E7496_11930 [Ruminococcus sp.]|nr:hypothetical protein [Ruminococcus sp.]